MASVQARILVALVDIRLADGAHVSGAGAVAGESIDPVTAASIVLARLRGTLVRVGLAPGPRISLWTFAGNRSTSSKDYAGPVVEAGIRLAERMDVDLYLAVLATVVGVAKALVITAGVLRARAPVHTGILGAWRSVVLLAILTRISGRAATLVALGTGGAGSMAHAGIVQTKVIRQAGEQIMIAAGTWSQGTSSKDHVLHSGVVDELESWAIEETAGEGVS